MTIPIRIQKYVFEIRYPALVKIFDSRGLILTKILKKFEDKTPHWSVENAAVSMFDVQGKPKYQLYVGHQRAYINYESPKSETEFLDDAKRFLSELQECFPEIKELSRVGFRSIVFVGGDMDLEYYKVKAWKKWLLEKLPISITPSDFSLTIEHELGRCSIAVAKPSDGIIQSTFPSSVDNCGDLNGIIFDVDTYVLNVALQKGDKLSSMLTGVKSATLASLEELEHSIGGE